MSKDLIKKHSESITHNTIGSIISYYIIQGVPTILGFIAALSSYFRGLPLYLVILIGSIVFFLLSITWDRILRKRRNLKGKLQDEASAALQSANSSQAATKFVQGFGTVDNNPPKCADVWLHNIANSNKRNISEAVRVESCEIKTNLSDIIPNIQLTFEIFNGSVYDISAQVSNEKGYLIFNKISLSSNGLELRTNTVDKIPNGSKGIIVLRQRLIPSEIDFISPRIQERDATFYLSQLNIMIVGGDDNSDIAPKRLNLPDVVSGFDVEKHIAAIKTQHQSEIQSLENKLATLNKDFEMLKVQNNELNEYITQHSWLHNIASAQARDIDNYVTLSNITLGDVFLNNEVPYIKFGLYVLNDSLFDVTIELGKSCCIVFRDQELHYPVKIVSDGLVNMQLGTERCLTIEQRLTHEEAHYISSSESVEDATFYFDRLVLTIKGGKYQTKDIRVKQKPLWINKGITLKGKLLTFRR